MGKNWQFILLFACEIRIIAVLTWYTCRFKDCEFSVTNYLKLIPWDYLESPLPKEQRQIGSMTNNGGRGPIDPFSLVPLAACIRGRSEGASQ